MMSESVAGQAASNTGVAVGGGTVGEAVIVGVAVGGRGVGVSGMTSLVAARQARVEKSRANVDKYSFGIRRVSMKE